MGRSQAVVCSSDRVPAHQADAVYALPWAVRMQNKWDGCR